MTTIGARIRAARLAAGLSQVALAERLGWPQSHLSRLETREGDPEIATVRAVCLALGVSADELLGIGRAPVATVRRGKR